MNKIKMITSAIYLKWKIDRYFSKRGEPTPGFAYLTAANMMVSWNISAVKTWKYCEKS